MASVVLLHEPPLEPSRAAPPRVSSPPALAVSTTDPEEDGAAPSASSTAHS
jgi:hypothetical protein